MGKTVSLLTKGAVGMNRRITVKYCFVQGGYWTLAAVAMAFTTPLLEAKGFSGTEIVSCGGEMNMMMFLKLRNI